LFQHAEDPLVGKAMEKKADNREAYDLGKQMRPVHTEGPRNFLDLPSVFDRRQYNQSVHVCPLNQWEHLLLSNRLFMSPSLFLFHKEQRIEYDCFSEGNREDGLDQNLCGSIRIASHGFRGFHAD